jgi:5-methylcytosine-specific restriction endonuclease McrA
MIWNKLEQSKLKKALKKFKTKKKKVVKKKIVFKSYKEYLLSNQWKKKRNIILTKNPICEICKINKSTEVHHKTYKHIFREKLSELTAICRDCHRSEHNLLSENEIEIIVNNLIKKDLKYGFYR